MQHFDPDIEINWQFSTFLLVLTLECWHFLYDLSATRLLSSRGWPGTKFSRSCIDCNLRWQKHFTQQPHAAKTVTCKYSPDFLKPFFCLQFKSNFTRLVKDGVFNPYTLQFLPLHVRSNEDPIIRHFLISSFSLRAKDTMF